MNGRSGARRRGRTALTLAFVVLLLVPSAGVVAADVVGSPDLDAYATDNRVAPGETTRLSISIVNTGEVEEGSDRNPSLHSQVTTAAGTVLRLKAGDAPIEVTSGTAALGSVPSGAAIPASFEISVDEDAAPGTYEVPVEISYQYAERVKTNGTPVEEERTVTRTVDVRVTENARFELVGMNTDAPVGGSGQVQVTLRNVGSATAEDATVSLQSGTNDLRFGADGAAETFLGDWAPGQTETVVVGADVARDATLRALPLSATVSWTDADDAPVEERISTGVVPATETRIGVAAASTTAATGDSGDVTLELTNTGERDLSDATVELASSNAGFTVGGASSATVYVGEWAAGETKEVTVEAAFAAGTEQRAYPVETTVSYTSADGRDAATAPVTVGITPADEQSFDVTDPAATLRVGAEGTVSGTLVNEGPGTVENAVLVLEPVGSTLDAVETEYALGDLESGAATDFTFDVAVSTGANDGPRQFTYHVEYEGTDGTTKQSDPLYVRTEVGPQRDVFDVNVTGDGFTASESGTYALEVTNAGDETLTDISAKLFADAPVSASSDEAFVDSLEPGETAIVQFDVSVAGSASAKTYPVSVDFQYSEPDGDTKLSDTYRLPVTVEERSGGGILGLGSGTALGVGVAVLVLLAIGGVLWSRR